MEPTLPKTEHIELTESECALLLVALNKLSITGTVAQATDCIETLTIAVNLKDKLNEVYKQLGK